MNSIEAIYCFLHYGRIKENLPISDNPKSGNIIITLCFTMLTVTILLSLSILFPDAIKSLFGTNSFGRTIGKIGTIFLIIIIYPIVKYTFGTAKKFKTTTTSFLKLSEVEQKLIAKKGGYFFCFSMAIIIIPIILSLVI